MNDKRKMLVSLALLLGITSFTFSTCRADETSGLSSVSVEDVLKKLYENSSKIKDLKSDTTMTSELNGAPFGGNVYCKTYFKAPDKEKTETYTDESRKEKTDIVLTTASEMCFIDAKTKTVQRVDMSESTNGAKNVVNQDFIYNQTAFLNNNTVTIDRQKSDWGNMIVVLTSVPKTKIDSCSKLELYIDYSKGTLKKMCAYGALEQGQEERLLQTMETTEFTQMPNGAWVPKEMKKIPGLSEGNSLVSTLTFTNQEINCGLTDDNDFNPEKQ